MKANLVILETPRTGERSADCLQRGVIPLAMPEIVPIEVATCPECGGRLIWQVTSTDGLEDMILECQNESETEEVAPEDWHRWWQGEWEPVINKVKA